MRRLNALCLLCLMLAAPLYAQDNAPYVIALQRIEEARESNATELYLYGLTELPPEIGQLSNLQVLYVEDSQLMTLPSEIGQLVNLQWLSLSFNRITNLPVEIGQLNNLRVSSLSDNQLTTLPSEIRQLSNLQALFLHGNQLKNLPAEIGQLSNLQVLSLSDNQLTTLPSEIRWLSRLCGLYLDTNNLSHLPVTIGNLTSLQSEICFFEFNQTTWWQHSGLILDGNPLISPPPEVVEQGTAAVLAYLRNQAWYHTQRLIIGAAGGVGLFALLLLGFRWKQRGGRKAKQNVG